MFSLVFPNILHSDEIVCAWELHTRFSPININIGVSKKNIFRGPLIRGPFTRLLGALLLGVIRGFKAFKGLLDFWLKQSRTQFFFRPFGAFFGNQRQQQFLLQNSH